jgi:hypothetical protein
MTIKHSLFAGFLAVLAAIPGTSATLAVDANATLSGSVYDYSYQFTITGAGADVDNIYLGSNDLSPLDVVIDVDGSPTTDWSWLGNDTPENYLQFFDIGGTSLGNGDTLDVTFTSPFAPSSTEFAVGYASSSGEATNTVMPVLGPAIAAPEPSSVPLLVAAGALLLVVQRRYGRRMSR